MFELDMFNKVQDFTLYAFFLAFLLKEIFCRARPYHKLNIVNNDENCYDSFKYIFLTDYARENPVTREEATEKLMKHLYEQQKSFAGKESIG